MRPRVHIPGMGDGVPLGELQPQMPPRSEHHTNFHGCSVGFYCLLDDDDRCKGYRVQIIDPWTNHTYNLDFGQEIKEEWRNNLHLFPNVGETPEEAEARNVS